MSKSNPDFEQIAKVADDIRVINNFAENHNFDKNLFSVPPNLPGSGTSHDIAIIVMVASMLSVLATAAIFLFWSPPLNKEMRVFVFLIGLLATIFATMSAHLKFKNNVITGAAAIGLIILLSIGAGEFTPREALDKASELAQ